MALPITFRKSPEGSVTSYNFYDIAEGTGIVKFYLNATETSSAIAYHLDTNPLYSAVIDVGFAYAAGGYTQYTDYDFDVSTFNLPKTIRGTGIVQITIQSWGTSAQ